MFCAWIKGIWDPYGMVFDAALVNTDSPDFKKCPKLQIPTQRSLV